MTGFDANAFQVVTDFIEICKTELDPLEIVPRDLHRIKAILKDAPKTHQLSKTLDPDQNDIRPSESFGLTLNYQDRTIACVCARSVRTDDFVREWITTDRLYGNMAPRLDFSDFEYTGHIPRISGVVGYGGGSWVHPQWRGMNLAGATSRLGKAVAATHLGVDNYVALIQQRREAWAGDKLGWPNGRYLTTGDHGGRDNWRANISIFWMTLDQIVDMCEETDVIAAVGRKVRSRLGVHRHAE